jgi:hypothetical protein
MYPAMSTMAPALDGLSPYAGGSHTARSPDLKVSSTSPGFDVAIEGSTIRLVHRRSGHVFEYLWCEEPPYLRNAIVRGR